MTIGYTRPRAWKRAAAARGSSCSPSTSKTCDAAKALQQVRAPRQEVLQRAIVRALTAGLRAAGVRPVIGACYPGTGAGQPR